VNKFVRAAAVALAVLHATSAHAHRAWLLPSSTVLSGTDLFVTVDAAISNDLFGFDHHALRLNGLVVTAPDGSVIEPENAATGKFRSVFDIPLKVQGTYRLAVTSNNLSASYQLNGEKKFWRGPAEGLAKLPTAATDVVVTEQQRRIETFVTSGKPSEDALKPAGQGLEMQPITHPNDLFAGEEAQFKLLIDGKPAAGVQVEIVRGGLRYRSQPDEASVTTGSDGVFKFKWPEAGMYLMEASVKDGATTIKEAKERRATYSATLEVLPN